MKKLLFISIVFSVATCSLYSQNKTIKGRLISNEFDILRGVPIMINDTVVVGRTDSKGFFQIDIPISLKKILFSYVGLETTSIELSDTCDEVEVVMLLRATYDFATPRKVDRLRMKTFKKLPKFYKEAFERGLFKADRPCYAQEFIPMLS